MRPKLNGPFGDSPCGLSVLNNILQGGRTNHSDGMAQEVLLKLSAGHKHPINKLLPVRISLLGLNQYLTNVITRSLDRVLLASLLAFHHDGHADSTRVSSHIQ